MNLISHVKDLVKIPLVIGGGFSSKDDILEVYKDYRTVKKEKTRLQSILLYD